MIIQHNIAALNSHRNMGLNNAGTSKNLEKLSSGYRINRAADDAAGLAISEKMRGQIRGLEMAEQNTSHGISLIQTAEGGLNETHAILQRMRELAVQSSNGTYQNEDRDQITKEYEALKSEVTRIADSTHYNNIKLLDGSLDSSKVAKGTMTIVDTVATGSSTGLTITTSSGASAELEALATSLTNQAYSVSSSVAADGNTKYSLTIDSKTYEGTLDATGANLVFEVDGTPNDGIKGNANFTFTFAMNTAATAASTRSLTEASGVYTQTDTSVVGFVIEGNTAGATPTGVAADDLVAGTQVVTAADSKYTTRVTTNVGGVGSNLVMQIGANGGADQRVNLAVADMSAKAIGITDDNGFILAGMSLQDSSIDSIDKANQAIEIITAATNMVSGQRAELGALQNRLEHTMNSLGVSKENLTAAESTIRDVDMAKEMMSFTKNNILVQASQAMLAQANQLPQGVLQLLR